MAENFFQRMGRKLIGADQARQQSDYGSSIPLEKVAARNPEKLKELVKEDVANTAKNKTAQKVAAGLAGAAGAIGAASVDAAKNVPSRLAESPFLDSYMAQRRAALNRIVGG